MVALPSSGPISISDKVPMPRADSPARRSRLSADTLKLGLGLLGIPSLERMVGVDTNSVWGFLAIRLESCLFHVHGIFMVSPLCF